MRTLRTVSIFRRNSSSSPVAMSRVWVAALCGLFLVLAASSAHAITYTWTGKGDGRSWNDPNNWSGVSRLLSPDACLCSDNAVIPAGANVSIDTSVSVGSITIGTGASLTVELDVVLSFGAITGSGALINNGTVTPCGTVGTLGSGITLYDYSDATWFVGIYQTLNFEKTAVDLKGYIIASSHSEIHLGSNVDIFTYGEFQSPGPLPCDYISSPGDRYFGWQSGPDGPEWCWL